ncbi:hypothetical protein [Nostoc sp.]|uniref:hypothetical protein n=1 Tax=Nostoc sp. TaxID=1180 RepID=UPI002FF52DCF
MFIERKINQSTKTVELWKCEWERPEGAPAKKVFISRIGEEQCLTPEDKNTSNQANAICWASGRTLGNIAVFSESILGSFPAQAGDDALLPCDFVHAGKFRHGADRWWCRIHQTHWGTKADHESYERLGVMHCANHSQPMNYTLAPLEINVNDSAEVGIWCSLPAALSTQPIESHGSKIHVHLRPKIKGTKTVDQDFDAISLLYHQDLGLFANPEITRVNITPPAAFEFMCATEENREMTCINCSKCGYPHLDLGDFARKPHRKHFCGNCGCDSTWSSSHIVSTPLKPLYDQLIKNTQFEEPSRTLNLDEYSGYDYTIWASTSAIVWTALRPQEKGIHIHVDDGHKRIVDDTFSVVILNGKPLDRKELLQAMIERTII